MHDIDVDLPDHRCAIQFRNQDKPCMVIHADKAASDAKNLREAARLMQSSPRGKLVAEWLNELAGKFETLDGTDGKDRPAV